MSKRLATWMLLGIATLTLPAALAQSQAQPATSAPVVVTPGLTNNSSQAQNIRKLLTIKEALDEKRARVRNLLERLGSADEVDREKLRGQITLLRQTIADLELSFENIAVSGASLRSLEDEPKQQLSWHDELMQIARPLLNSLKEATEKPRRIEELRREIDLYQRQLEVTHRAIESLAKFHSEAIPLASQLDLSTSQRTGESAAGISNARLNSPGEI